MGSNGAAVGMVDFVGNAVTNNSTQNFVNVGHSATACISGAGFVQQDNFASMQMLARSFEGQTGAATTRVGMNGGGGYSFAYSSAMGVGQGVVSSLGQQMSSGQFLKPGTANGDDQPTATQL